MDLKIGLNCKSISVGEPLTRNTVDAFNDGRKY